MAATLDRAADEREPVIGRRERGKPAAVILLLEDFGAYAETEYLLRSPRNAEELRKSIAEIEAGGGVDRQLIT